MYNSKQFNKLILASGSPRRQAMLSKIAKEVLIMPQDVLEITDEVDPQEIVMALSVLKLGSLPNQFHDIPVISGDTIVWMDGKQYGKPNCREIAINMLLELVGKWHTVYSGYAIAYRGVVYVDWASARVKFKKLTRAAIEQYIDTHKPFDKAGAYGLQDNQVVERYNGDADTIIGLPMNRLSIKLSAILDKK